VEHVNMSQSTNDVYPTAVKLALHFGIQRLTAAMAELRAAFDAKAAEFADVLKMGRTQLQDAVPMTLGQEFSTYAVMLEEDEQRLKEAALLIHEINLGATAIGTGITAHPEYAPLACRRLSEVTGIALVTASNLVEATQDAGAFVQLSGVLKRVAVKLSKTCNDLRLLSSGPRAGLGEINLPPVQAGSSIMPGKVNPVIPEVMNQIAFEVIGNDVTVTLAAEAGSAQRIRARHRPQPVQEPHAPQKRMRHPARPLHHRHHREPRTPARIGGELDRDRHRAQSLYRLRERDDDRAGSSRERPQRLRAGA
jgi:aspartate ammonia-lyase